MLKNVKEGLVTERGNYLEIEFYVGLGSDTTVWLDYAHDTVLESDLAEIRQRLKQDHGLDVSEIKF